MWTLYPMVKQALSGDMGETFPHICFIRYHSIYFAASLYYWCTIYFYSKFLTSSNLYCRKKDHGIAREVYIVVSICLFWCIVFAYMYQDFCEIYIFQENGWSSSTQDGKVVEIYEMLKLEDSWVQEYYSATNDPKFIPAAQEICKQGAHIHRFN